MKKLTYIFLILNLLSCGQENSVSKKPLEINLDELTVSEVHRNFEAGNYTSAQLVSAYLERIEKQDSILNAISYVNRNAVDQAKKLDEEFESTGKLRPLHGIPLIVKDNFNTIGMPTTAGSLALKDFRPKSNASMVRQLLDAGAVIIAKSNMAEWAFSPMHTESSTHGTTRNPYNTEYVPAGSSGGTGASISANFGLIGLGTDTGNSIRGPSSHNALVGFRSTVGLTSRAGIVPLYLRNDIAGPMCRTVTDATKVLNLIAKADPKDSITEYAEGKRAADYTLFLDENGLQGARIGVLRELSDNNPDKEITQLFNAAIQDIERLGATTIDSLEIPNFSELLQNQWCDEFRKDVEAYLAEFVKSDTLATIEDIIRIGTASPYAEESLIHFRDAETGRNGEPCKNIYEDARSIAFRDAIEQTMDKLKLDAIMYPSWNNIPATIENFEEEYQGDNSQIIAPHTGQPAFTVPMGFTSKNLPAGLQFLGRMYAEPTLIKLAYAYEQGTGHRQKPYLK